MEQEYYLPLYLYANEPIAVYVVDDKIIGFELVGDYKNNGMYAFYLLGKLAKNKLARKTLPNHLVQKHELNFDRIPFYHPCLSGIMEEWLQSRCFAANMSIIKNSDNVSVHFHDFALLERRDFYVNYLAAEINVTPHEAFILLANICVNYWDIKLVRFKQFGFFDKEHAYQQLADKYDEMKRKKHPSYWHYFGILFCYDYLEYLGEKLATGTITADELLRLNGARVIAILPYFIEESTLIRNFILDKVNALTSNFNQLTLNQKLCYYTLYLLVKDVDLLKKNHHIFNIKHPKRNLIKEELGIKYPRKKGKLVDRNLIYQKYFNLDYEDYLLLNKKRRENMFL